MPYKDIAKRRAHYRSWAKINKEKIALAHRKYYYNNIERESLRKKTMYYSNCRIDRKIKVMNIYGNGKCLYCGDRDLAVLSIDHINDDGAYQRKQNNQIGGGDGFYRKLLKLSTKRNDLQVLCMSCQFRKRQYGSDLAKWPLYYDIKVYSLIEYAKEVL